MKTLILNAIDEPIFCKHIGVFTALHAEFCLTRKELTLPFNISKALKPERLDTKTWFVDFEFMFRINSSAKVITNVRSVFNRGQQSVDYLFNKHSGFIAEFTKLPVDFLTDYTSFGDVFEKTVSNYHLVICLLRHNLLETNRELSINSESNVFLVEYGVKLFSEFNKFYVKNTLSGVTIEVSQYIFDLMYKMDVIREDNQKQLFKYMCQLGMMRSVLL